MFRRTMFLLAMVALAGCHQSAPPFELTAQEFSLSGPDDRDAIFEACLEVLRVHRFKLDRVDRLGGVVSTFPVTSQSFFEFWRNDVTTHYDRTEATLRTVRRRVEIRLTDAADRQHKKLIVTVHRERFSTPDRQYNSAAAAFRVFSSGLPSTAGTTIVPARDNVWIPAGRDGAFEQKLLREITARMFTGNAGQPS